MEQKYKTLHNKMKKLSKRAISEKQNISITKQPRVIYLNNKQLKEEQINILRLAPQYAMEISPRKYINNIKIETKYAIRIMEPKWQMYTDSKQRNLSKG